MPFAVGNQVPEPEVLSVMISNFCGEASSFSQSGGNAALQDNPTSFHEIRRVEDLDSAEIAREKGMLANWRFKPLLEVCVPSPILNAWQVMAVLNITEAGLACTYIWIDFLRRQ